MMTFLILFGVLIAMNACMLVLDNKEAKDTSTTFSEDEQQVFPLDAIPTNFKKAV